MKSSYEIFANWTFASQADLEADGPKPGVMYAVFPKRVLIFGGLDGDNGLSKDVFWINKDFNAGVTDSSYIDFSTINSNSGDELDIGMALSTTITINNYVYIIGGYEKGPSPDYLYTPTDRVMRLTVDPTESNINRSGIVGQHTIPGLELPYLLARPAHAVTRDKILLLGGHGTYSEVSDDILYSDVNYYGKLGTWKHAGTLPRPIAGGHAVVKNDYLYIFGGALSLNTDNQFGQDSTNPGYLVPNLNIYKTRLNNLGLPTEWENAGTLTAPFFGGRIFSFDRTVVLVGGSHNPYVQSYRFSRSGDLLDNHIFSPEQGVDDPAIIYNGPLYDFGLIVQGSNIYVFGGSHRHDTPTGRSTEAMVKNFNSLLPGGGNTIFDPVNSPYYQRKHLATLEGHFYLPNKMPLKSTSDLRPYITY